MQKIMRKGLTLLLLTAAIALVCWAVFRPRTDLQKVRQHYANDSLKLAAANFLLDNMDDKFAYAGKEIERFDTIFGLFNRCIVKEGDLQPDPQPVVELWDSLTAAGGNFNIRRLDKLYDERHLTAAFIEDNIDAAFDAWQSIPDSVITKDFRMFCEYVLPYRIGREIPEQSRRRLFSQYRGMRDTMMTDISKAWKVMDNLLRRKLGYKNSQLLWRYPVSMSVSQFEKARRGACLHVCEYYVHVLRAMGIPATIDFVDSWGNRGGGHCWVVAMKDSTRQFAIDALSGRSFRFTYKPAKIWRRTFSKQNVEETAYGHVPPGLLDPYRIDVTDKYKDTHNFTISCDASLAGKLSNKPYAVLCVFDRDRLVAVDYGKVAGVGRFCFHGVAGGNVYIAASYDDGKLSPISAPFLLDNDGTITMITASGTERQTMKLKRKYPRFKRMETFARSMQRSRVEAADNAAFKGAVTLMTVKAIPHDVNDSTISCTKKYRYIRWKMLDDHSGNIAEVMFFGKHTSGGNELPLKGAVIGSPASSGGQTAPFRNAMDGDYATYFSKRVGEVSFVGLDLGAGNEAYLTRVKFYPRSDTNFILPGDNYELLIWANGKWTSVGRQVAKGHELTFMNVPKGALYLLRDLTKGNEERIFTYEKGKQVWR